jgi:xylulokinase
MTLFIGADLGTSGCKAALFDDAGQLVASALHGYRTSYPRPSWHEQDLHDWWTAFAESIRDLVEQVPERRHEIVGIGVSGQSLAPILLDEAGCALSSTVPIWSDSRAGRECRTYFESQDETTWYQRTGNGFPSGLYTIFKVMWARENQPDTFRRTRTIVGSKDWINHRLTGNIRTDHSYASGSGFYDLRLRTYADDLLQAAGLESSLFPLIVDSSDIVGELLPHVALDLGLEPGIAVVAGGVDNSCMALGAQNTAPGRIYASLGSSSWLTICDQRPILEPDLRPFVFAHVIPGLYNSAVSTFSAGTSVAWVMETLFPELGGDVDAFVETALGAPPGADGALFVPSIAGGTVFEGGPPVRGSYAGLSAPHRREHLARAVIEGIPLALRRPLDELRRIAHVENRIVVTGGGSRNGPWLQTYANILDCELVKTSVEQQAATLGAATLVAVGLGHWPDYSRADEAHEITARYSPDVAVARIYSARVLPRFAKAVAQASDLARLTTELDRPQAQG